MLNEYTISDGYSMMKLVRHPITWLFDRYTDQFAISRFLATEVDFWCIHAWDKKYARWIQRSVRVTDHKCGIGIWSIFDMVFRYLPIFLTVLRYWVAPNVPLHECTFVILTYLSNWLTFIDSAYTGISQYAFVVGFHQVFSAHRHRVIIAIIIIIPSSSKALYNKCFQLKRLESSSSWHYKKEKLLNKTKK